MASDAAQARDWGREFDQRFRLHDALRGEILFTIEEAAKDAEVKTHSITCRVKERTSFLEKVVRKNYSSPFDEMPDIVGARVVCLFMDDLPKLKSLVQEKFLVRAEEDKIEAAPADSFGYMSIHFECEVRPEHSGPRYDKLKGVRFEVQIRTLLMDAWANVSHYLEYKGEASIPEELRRSFHALSGLFYVADQNFQSLYNGSTQSERRAAQSTLGEGVDLPVDRSTIGAVLRELYPDREESDLRTISEFTEEVIAAGYDDLEEIRRVLKRADALAREEEEVHPPLGRWGEKFTDVGLARNALAVADPSYADVKYSDRDRYAPYHARYLQIAE